MSHRIQWRELTPKGNLGKFGLLEGLTEDDVLDQLRKLLPKACWLYVQKDEVDFPGNSLRREKKRK